MIIANGADVSILEEFLDGKQVGTRFHANENPNFKLEDYIMKMFNYDYVPPRAKKQINQFTQEYN